MSAGPGAASRVHAVIRGLVQGVGFRYFVRDRAERSGLRGWVRNRPDGAVECVAEGERGDLEELVAALREGPPWARVSEVEVSWEAPGPEPEGFRVT